MKCKCGHDSYNHPGVNNAKCELCGCKKFIGFYAESIVETNKVPKIYVGESGAKRSSRKPRYDLIGPYFLQRIAYVWDKGAVKYGEYNWQKAIISADQDYIKDIPNHIIEHIYQWLSGDRTEDHLANICCNVQMLMYEELLHGRKETKQTD